MYICITWAQNYVCPNKIHITKVFEDTSWGIHATKTAWEVDGRSQVGMPAIRVIA
jgi:hypothetical protein